MKSVAVCTRLPANRSFVARWPLARAPENSRPFRMKTSSDFFTSCSRKSILACSAGGRSGSAARPGRARSSAAISEGASLRATVVLDQLEECLDLDRLLQVVGVEGLGLLDGAAVGRHDHDGYGGQLRVSKLLGAELPAVHDRHHEVEQDDTGPLRP